MPNALKQKNNNTGFKALHSWTCTLYSQLHLNCTISKCHDFDLWCLPVSFLSALGMLLRLHGEAFRWLSPQCASGSVDLHVHWPLKGPRVSVLLKEHRYTRYRLPVIAPWWVRVCVLWISASKSKSQTNKQTNKPHVEKVIHWENHFGRK